MLDPKSIKNFAEQFVKILPPAMDDLRTEVRQNAEQLLQKLFKELNLVTREEFDVQTQVLQRTRIKLEELSKKISS